jgi:hypothetical protein
VQNLTKADVIRLDAFEGDVPPLPTTPLTQEYERRDVTVDLMEEERKIPAATYIWIASEDRLAKEEWNFEEFCREKIGRWTGKSEEFKDSDAVATGGRAAWNGELVRSAM